MSGGKGDFVHAIRGPIVLIALGILFLIDLQGVYRFSQTWPVLLILLGLLSLLAHSLSERGAR
ncbi:MAG: DUF5668 domain-containing protein [Bryobacteraceae bacterium]